MAIHTVASRRVVVIPANLMAVNMQDLLLSFSAELKEFDISLGNPEAAYDGRMPSAAQREQGRALPAEVRASASQDVRPSDIMGDAGLLTAIILSLFTDARAHADDSLPDERVGIPSDLRGWWGDCLGVDETRPFSLGSRLWLLSREKELPVVVARAQEYAQEALNWLVEEGRTNKLVVTASHVAPAYLGISVQALPFAGAGEEGREWNFVYDYQNAEPVNINTYAF